MSTNYTDSYELDIVIKNILDSITEQYLKNGINLWLRHPQNNDPTNNWLLKYNIDACIVVLMSEGMISINPSTWPHIHYISETFIKNNIRFKMFITWD